MTTTTTMRRRSVSQLIGQEGPLTITTLATNGQEKRKRMFDAGPSIGIKILIPLLFE